MSTINSFTQRRAQEEQPNLIPMDPPQQEHEPETPDMNTMLEQIWESLSGTGPENHRDFIEYVLYNAAHGPQDLGDIWMGWMGDTVPEDE